MRFRLPIVLLVLSLAWPKPLYSQAIRVAVIPLTFYSKEDLSNLRKPVMDSSQCLPLKYSKQFQHGHVKGLMTLELVGLAPTLEVGLSSMEA